MTALTAADAIRELKAAANPADAEVLQRFFRTGKGEYAEGDKFLGIRVPAVRELARRYYDLPLSETAALLESPLHEARHLALILMVRLFERGDDKRREKVFHAYLDGRAHINNWDLVDVSAGPIVGGHLYREGSGISGSGRKRLTSLAESKSLWDRRIAIIATQHFIAQGYYDETFRLAEILLNDRQDLIHKAVGWMLKEVGKRDRALAEQFLKRHYRVMPRTMLRYAIEKYPEALRAEFMARRQP